MFMAQVERDAAVRCKGNEAVIEALSAGNRDISDGPVTLRPIPGMIRLPLEHEQCAIDYHAVARDSLGRIYVLYNSLDRTASTRALARFRLEIDESGDETFKFERFLGTRDWAEGTPHSLEISVSRSDNGDRYECMTIVNNDGTIIHADIDGRELWNSSISNFGPKAPTCAAVDPHGEIVAVVDGYGTNKNYVYSGLTGKIEKTTGEEGDGDGQSRTNHGITLEPNGNFVVADRGNERLTWWSEDDLRPLIKDGSQVALNLPDLQVCNISFYGECAVVPCLNSKLAFLAPDGAAPCGYKLVAVVTMPSFLIAAGIDGIHDAEFSQDGRYLIVSVWERHRSERQIPTLTAFRITWPELLRQSELPT
jgi:hypothetical protein